MPLTGGVVDDEEVTRTELVGSSIEPAGQLVDGVIDGSGGCSGAVGVRHNPEDDGVREVAHGDPLTDVARALGVDQSFRSQLS